MSLTIVPFQLPPHAAGGASSSGKSGAGAAGAQGGASASGSAGGGFDPVSLSIQAFERQLEAIRQQIARVQADKTMPALDKAQELTTLNNQAALVENSIMQLELRGQQG